MLFNFCIMLNSMREMLKCMMRPISHKDISLLGQALKKKWITTGKYYHFIPTLFLLPAHISRAYG